MPTKSTFSRGATTSRIPFPAAVASSALVGRAEDVPARLLVRLKLDERLLLGFLEELREAAEAIVGFVEAGLAALERLLHHRAPDALALAALGDERVQRFDQQIEALLLLVLVFAGARGGFAALLRRAALLLVGAHQVVVVDEFVAVVDEEGQIGRANV